MKSNKEMTKEDLYLTTRTVILDKFPKTKFDIFAQYENYAAIKNYDLEKTKIQIPDELFILHLSNYMTKIITDNYNLKLADCNNVRVFLYKSMIKNKKEDVLINKNEYITMRKFCKENLIVESEMKSILTIKGYYNEKFKFMPSRKALEKDKFRPKACSTIYVMNYGYNVDFNKLGNFYINWEYQFLRNMMLKYYDHEKVKKERELNKKPEVFMRYIISKNIKNALDNIRYVASVIEDMVYYGNYDVIMNDSNSYAEYRDIFEVLIEVDLDSYIFHFDTYNTMDRNKKDFYSIEIDLIKAIEWSQYKIKGEKDIEKYNHYSKLFYRFIEDFKKLLEK